MKTLTQPPAPGFDSIPVRSDPVRTLPGSDAPPAFDLLARAFRDDPGVRWLFPGDALYEGAFPAFARAFAGAAFAAGTAHAAGDRLAVALWLPPGAHADEERLGLLLDATIPADRKPAAYAVFEQMTAFHPPGPHWHLPLIGTEPGARGLGLGSGLLRHGLALCDREGLPAYLEATAPRNAALYARFGFRPVGRIQAGDSPPILPMVRPAK